MTETHYGLRNGDGFIFTTTHSIRFLNRLIQFIEMEFDPEASIGWHFHNNSSEIYFTFNRNIRFNEEEKWKRFNICKKGGQHCVKNLSKDDFSNIYAIKVSKI